MILVNSLEVECTPERAHFTDAGLDLKAKVSVEIGVGEVVKVPVGIRLEIPTGHVGLIFPRSGLGSKKGIILANTVGVIDSDYRGEVICVLKNTSSFPYTVDQYERVAQLVVVPCLIGDFLEVNEEDLSDTDRGEGGFGHTGTQ